MKSHSVIGGARNLKLGAMRGQGPGHKSAIMFVGGLNVDLISVVCIKKMK